MSSGGHNFQDRRPLPGLLSSLKLIFGANCLNYCYSLPVWVKIGLNELVVHLFDIVIMQIIPMNITVAGVLCFFDVVELFRAFTRMPDTPSPQHNNGPWFGSRGISRGLKESR